jgi:exopolyphosphatase/guanosine-5'-triphosphate,3'-diphosphate pyrophosphatase
MRQKRVDATISFVIEAARTYDPDPAHNEMVTDLALALFDGLRPLHGYGPTERRLLEIASRLHDIGWSRVVSGKHHKGSARMILDLGIPGLDEQDQLIVALIARYHTKAVPDLSRHRRFGSLGSGRRELIEWLAGMLRVADGLDSRHANAVKQMVCEISSKVIKIHLQVVGDCRMEIEQASRKAALLVWKAARKIQYQC